MGLPPRIVIPVATVFAVLFLGVMGYFLKIGFTTEGSAFGPGIARSQGDAKIEATPVPISTDPPGTIAIPQSGTGPVAQNATAPLPGNNVGGGGPPAPVLQLLNDLHARLDKNPQDIAALVELGNLYFDAQKFDQAVSYYQRSLKLDPTNPDVRNDEAAALHASGHDLDALREIDKVLAERPDFPQALFNKGVVLRAMGRRSDAADAYRAYLKVAPHDSHAAEAKAAVTELSS
jgi:tetratricopeptide (TPR) repeat protein